MDGNAPSQQDNISQILAEVEEDVYRNERMIKLSVALDYMIQLVDPKFRPIFEQAERSARTVEEMNRVIELAKKHIGQRTAISMLGI